MFLFCDKLSCNCKLCLRQVDKAIILSLFVEVGLQHNGISLLPFPLVNTMSQTLTHKEIVKSYGEDLILASEFAHGLVLSLDELKERKRHIAPSFLYCPENIRMNFPFFTSICVCDISQEGVKHSQSTHSPCVGTGPVIYNDLN